MAVHVCAFKTYVCNSELVCVFMLHVCPIRSWFTVLWAADPHSLEMFQDGVRSGARVVRVSACTWEVAVGVLQR